MFVGVADEHADNVRACSTHATCGELECVDRQQQTVERGKGQAAGSEPGAGCQGQTTVLMHTTWSVSDNSLENCMLGRRKENETFFSVPGPDTKIK